MELSKTEILVLEQAAKGNKGIKGIAKALGKSDKQIYVTVAKLAGKGMVQRSWGSIELVKSPHVVLLIQQLARSPNLVPALSDSGMTVLSSVVSPSTPEQIERRTGLRKTIIYEKLAEAKKRSFVVKEDHSYRLNDKVWPLMKELMEETARYEATADSRIPAGSVIYKRRGNDIVFSCREEVDATRTAFSAYQDYGIKLRTHTNYYCLPKRQLSEQDVLEHSLYVVEKEWSATNVTYIALFYAKFRNDFAVTEAVKDTSSSVILKNIGIILRGGKVGGYPSREEIAEKAAVYGIKV